MSAQRAAPPARWPRAFSLLELILVLAIVATLSMIAAPRYINALGRHRVDMAAHRVESDLALARSRAVALSVRQSVVFDVDPANSYSIVGMADPDRPPDTYDVHLSGGPYHVRIVSVDLGGNAKVVYNGYGVPNVGGTILLRSGDHEATVEIAAPTDGAIIE